MYIYYVYIHSSFRDIPFNPLHPQKFPVSVLPKAHVHLPPGRWDALEELLTQLDGHLETRADAALVLHEVVHASMG